jgi:hypothetical protein
VPKKPSVKTEPCEWHLEAVNRQQARFFSLLYTGSIEPGLTIARFGIRLKLAEKKMRAIWAAIQKDFDIIFDIGFEIAISKVPQSHLSIIAGFKRQ